MAITRYVNQWDDLSGESDESTGIETVQQSVLVYSDDPVNDTESTARLYLVANAPLLYGTLSRSKIAVTELVKRDGNEAIWRARITYTSPEKSENEPEQPVTPDTNDPQSPEPLRLSVRNAGQGLVKKLYSELLLDEVSEGYFGDEYDFKGTDLENAIGIDYDGSINNPDFMINGIDVPFGTVQIIGEQAVPAAYISAGYLVRLAEAANASYTNDDVFQGFPRGTLRFTTFDATQNGAAIPSKRFWRFTFTFEYERNRPIADINAELAKLGFRNTLNVATEKKGHEFLEILRVQKEIEVRPGPPPVTKIVTAPVRASIHQVFKETDYHSLFDYTGVFAPP